VCVYGFFDININTTGKFHIAIAILYLSVLKMNQMRTDEIIKEIQQLPLQKRIYVIEEIIRSIRKQSEKDQMEYAADSLYEDYKNDKNLTIFTDIDFENFYETK
jgi:hypothetical protein